MRLSAHKDAFTLIELLVVVGILAVVSGFLIPSFSGYIDNQSLRQAQDQVVTDLRSLQNRALTGVGYSDVMLYWAAKFDPNDNERYGHFIVDQDLNGSSDLGELCSVQTPTEFSKKLQGEVVIRNTSEFCVFFSFDNGDAQLVSSGATDVILGYSGGTECLRVIINSAGYVFGPDKVFVACT